MAAQIRFFLKNKADLSNENVLATASQGDDYAQFPRNRNNQVAWVTSGSVDADLTTYRVDFADTRLIDSILLLKQNFASYKIEYWNGLTWVSVVDVTGNTTESRLHSISQISTDQLKLTVRGTMTPNEDKYLYQFIATEAIGQLAGWPVIKNPLHSRSRTRSNMLSGKAAITESVGAFSCELQVKEWKSNADLTIVEELYLSDEGFLVWLCGGDEDQFSSERLGYRLEDIALMKCVNDYEPEFLAGQYLRGLGIAIKLVEVVD